ncbi:hypothetical protein DXG01_009965 [Tephrocybe rancida]|nr:hypothetical protein DXG01_009965 [Tephrocybe rancida]
MTKTPTARLKVAALPKRIPKTTKSLDHNHGTPELSEGSEQELSSSSSSRIRPSSSSSDSSSSSSSSPTTPEQTTFALPDDSHVSVSGVDFDYANDMVSPSICGKVARLLDSYTKAVFSLIASIHLLHRDSQLGTI